jgi:g-D-glutamyl-meso-diaminopimelate peptidase
MNELPVSDFTGSQDIISAMLDLASQVPGLNLMEIGQSVMGAPLLAAGLGYGKRRVIFTAAHHANEWLTGLVLLRFLQEMSTRPDWQYILRRNTLCFIPLVNPDGVDLVTGALSEGPYFSGAVRIARNYPGIPFPNGWKASIKGIDLNLQYPTRWELARELKYAAGFTSPAPRDFVGYSPLQSNEAGALANFTNIFSPDLLLALHSQGEVIYYMSNGCYPEGTFPLVRQMADLSGYVLAETPSYSDNAGYKDWFIDKFDRPGFTLEIGRGENPLPITDFDSVYAKVAPMLLLCSTGAR